MAIESGKLTVWTWADSVASGADATCVGTH
jgi:hypothetical protein